MANLSAPRYIAHLRQGGSRPLSGQQTRPTKRNLPRLKTSAETRARIRLLFEQGESLEAISAAVGQTVGYVEAHLRRSGDLVNEVTRLIPGMKAWLALPAFSAYLPWRKR